MGNVRQLEMEVVDGNLVPEFTSDFAKERWYDPSKLKVKNVLDQEVQVGVAWSQSKYQWDGKYLTTSCQNCSCFIPLDQARIVLEHVYFWRGRRKWWVSPDYQGICNWSGPDAAKVLYDNPHNPPRRCELFGKTREPIRRNGWFT